ncbi:hypothetical protein APR12_003291 [Nocardia amikacinitolerans]|nr:hypothetical protein [Nocardia amikacinitolerans]
MVAQGARPKGEAAQHAMEGAGRIALVAALRRQDDPVWACCGDKARIPKSWHGDDRVD